MICPVLKCVSARLSVMLLTGAPTTIVTALACIGAFISSSRGALAAESTNMHTSNRHLRQRHSTMSFVGCSTQLCPTRQRHRQHRATAAAAAAACGQFLPMAPRQAVAAGAACESLRRSRGTRRDNSDLVGCQMTTTEEVSVLQLPRLDGRHVAVVWFTACDLRTHDHDALVASASASGVVPLYVFDNQVRYTSRECC